MKNRLALLLATVALSLSTVNSYAQKLGIAGYSYRNFSIEKTLDVMDRMDVRYLCIKSTWLPISCSQQEADDFMALLKSKNIQAYGIGPIYMNTKKDVDAAFIHAKRLGVKVIVGVPKHELLSYVNEKVQEYDMKYAIHLHGPDMKLYPNATDVWSHVKDLDPRMGICLDIGHTVRDGYDPSEDFKRYRSRIFDIHLKDVSAASKKGYTIEIGRGVIDIQKFIKTIRKYDYEGVCHLEFEKDKEDPFIGIAESIGYFKAAMKYTK